LIFLKYKRKGSIVQMQITDYIFEPKVILFLASIPKQRIERVKLLTSVPRKKKQKRGRKRDVLKLFYKIDHFIKKGDLTPIQPAYLRKFRDIKVLPESEIIYSQISNVEKLTLKGLSGFTGFFEYLIYCINFAYFDDLLVELENKNITFRNKFLHDIIIHELTRIQIGIDNYRLT